MGTEKQEELLQIKNLAISFYNKSGEVQAVRGISYTLHKSYRSFGEIKLP